MRVYVWQQYGHIHVYAADDLHDLERLFNTMVGALESWGMDDEIEDARHFLKKGLGTGRTDFVMRAINHLADIGRGHESFEYNGFTEMEHTR